VPSTTWTPHAVESELFRLRRRLWRAVETQHIASTLRLVATAEEQDTLELILEASKPPVPAEAARLHYLLATPFRYPSPFGSRFRAPTESGVWYGTEVLRSACAELGYWRWRFLMDSEGLETLGPSPQTVFQASIDTRAVDLTRAPFRRDQARWGHRSDYGPTQQFAVLARAAKAGAIRYASVRDPEHAAAVAVLRADAFKPLRPIQQVTWFLTLKPERVIWRREGESFEFDASAWQ
jgi:RES domain